MRFLGQSAITTPITLECISIRRTSTDTAPNGTLLEVLAGFLLKGELTCLTPLPLRRCLGNSTRGHVVPGRPPYGRREVPLRLYLSLIYPI